MQLSLPRAFAAATSLLLVLGVLPQAPASAAMDATLLIASAGAVIGESSVASSGTAGAAVSGLPVGTITSPREDAAGQGSLTLSGTATASTGLRSVTVALTDVDRGLWLAADGSWTARRTELTTTTTATSRSKGGSSAVTWKKAIGPIRTARLRAQVTVVDKSGVSSASYDPPGPDSLRTFWYYAPFAANPADTQPPKLQGRWPFDLQTVTDPSGRLVVTGTAHDDVAVHSVRVGVMRVSDGRWLSPNGVFDAAESATFAPLQRTGSALVSYALPVTLPTTGAYLARAWTFDAPGKSEQRDDRFTFDPAAQPDRDSSFVSLIMSRSPWVDAPGCVATPGAKTLFTVADQLRARGRIATGTIVVERPAQTTRTCWANCQLNASWEDLRTLQNTYG